jgi:hypothetical protein
MPLPGLVFIDPPPAEAVLTSRADVTLFVGLVKRREGELPKQIRLALDKAGWGAPLRNENQIKALMDAPVPIDSFEQFDALFASNARPTRGSAGEVMPTALGLAVRSFFAEGGRKCYVVRCGDPVSPNSEPDAQEGDHRALRRRLVDWPRAAPPADFIDRAPLIPGWRDDASVPRSDDRRTWRGVGHILGLDDVAMISVPDLPDLLAVEPRPLPDLPEPPSPPETFKPCADAPASAPGVPRRSRTTAARLDKAGYEDWAGAIGKVLDYLKTSRGGAHRRDVMLIAGLPLPAQDDESGHAEAEGNPLGLIETLTRNETSGLAQSALLQLAYPWVETPASAAMPEGVENPEGVLAGVLARNALMRGAFRSAAALPTPSVRATLPALERAQIERASGDFADWLGDRICLIGRAVGGFHLLSDATMSKDRAYRAGGVSRLIGIIIRAGRMAGQELVFERSSEPTWTRLRRRLEEFLTELWRLGALNGDSPRQAFEVRCGRATMTQADMDAGRLIAEISVVAAQPIERITITLSLGDANAMERAA